MKQQLKQKLFIVPFLVLGVFGAGMALPPMAVAHPLTIVAETKAGDPCTLPSSEIGKIQADNRTCCPDGTADDTSCLFAKYINPAIQLLAGLIGVVIAISIIVGGIQYTTSEGDPQKAAAAKSRITNALIGLAAFLLLYAFLQFIIPGGVLNG